jgi:flagellar basal body P-ring formation protein FlgA
MYQLLLLAIASPPAFEDLDLLDKRVTAVAPNASAIDKRLKLAQCPEEPVVAPPAGGSLIVRCPAVGWRLRVSIKPDLAAAASSAPVIRKGEMVECVSEGPGFAVSTMMLALDDAAAGEPVRVKSPTSATVVTATAKARGLVSF